VSPTTVAQRRLDGGMADSGGPAAGAARPAAARRAGAWAHGEAHGGGAGEPSGGSQPLLPVDIFYFFN